MHLRNKTFTILIHFKKSIYLSVSAALILIIRWFLGYLIDTDVGNMST